MSAGTAMGISLTTITTDLQLPLGFIHTEPANEDHAGERTFIYVSIVFGGAIAGADIAVGNLLAHTLTTTTGSETYADLELSDDTSGATEATAMVGASQQAWTWIDHYPSGAGAGDALFGFVQRTGLAQVLCMAGVLPDRGIGPGATAGQADVTVANAASCGYATAGATGLNPVRLYCQG